MGVDGREKIMELETGKPVERTEVIMGRENIYERIFAGLSRTKKNLFMIGDGAGVTRGLVQASASGLLAAREILRRTGAKG